MKRLMLTAVVLLPTAAAAHHGWGGYDSNRVLKLSGVVREANFENPHGMLRLQTPDKTWTVVLSPPARMVNRGLSTDAIKVGGTVLVEGYPNKTVADEMRAERITVSDKTVELR
jgi:hypothetical protein